MGYKISDLQGASLPLAGNELLELTQGGNSRQVRVMDLLPGFDGDTLAAELASSEGAKKVGAADGGVVQDALQFVAPEQFGTFSPETLVQAIDTGKAVVIGAADTSVTLTTTAQVQAVLGALDRMLVLGSQLTINLPSGQHAIASRVLARVQNNAKIKLQGASTVETSITSIVSVTGSAGAWSVTAAVTNAAGISVGDVLCIRNVKPGVQTPGTYSGRPQVGALQMQFFQNGELSLSGTTGSVTNAVLPTYVGSGDFLIADGKVKRMTSITASGFAVDSANAPPKAYSGRQYWFTMRPSGAGTVTVSGNIVTGTGTTFLSRVNPGDLICFMGWGIRKVQSVDSDTQLTLTASHPAVASGVVWGVIVPGEVHEGAWVVTSVVGNQVTWTNTSRNSYGPPAKLVNAGDVYCLKTNLVFSGTSGVVADGHGLEIDRIGLRGSGGSATVGIDLRGEGGERFGSARLGTRVGVAGFHYGARLSVGSALQATSAHFGGQLTRGVDVAGGAARLGSSAVGGVNGIGVFVGEGAYCRMADIRVHGCTYGLRKEVGGSAWVDFGVLGHNTQDGILDVGGTLSHFVGVRALGNGGSAVTGQNGGFGRMTGMIALGNGYRGANWGSGKMEGNQNIYMGNGDSGVVLTSMCEFNLQECSFGFNGANGLYCLTMSEAALTGNCQFIRNGSAGIQVTSHGKAYAPDAGFESNGTFDVSALTGGKAYINGRAGTSAFNITINTPQADESVISDA